MAALREILIEKIRSEGAMTFESFMEYALYDPRYGYYTSEGRTIGREGDFYTSPHLHRVFGALIGRQMEEMWELLDRPRVFHIVEMGGGAGYLAKDLLGYLMTRELFHRIRYHIVEVSPSLRRIQAGLLADVSQAVAWHSTIRELEGVVGCFLSNELLDSFPVAIVEMDDELQEIFVSCNGSDFRESRKPCREDIRRYFEEFSIELPNGYRTEVNIRIRDWLNSVSAKLISGFVLTIDYGYPAWEYYDEERNRGTLLCYYRHQIVEDPYRHIGEQDITAHVNFSSLKRWGEGAGLRTLGYCSQGTYLVSLGLDEVINELYGVSPDPFEIAKIKGLVLPQGMGESHKVVVQSKGERDYDLRGFSLRNQVEKL